MGSNHNVLWTAKTALVPNVFSFPAPKTKKILQVWPGIISKLLARQIRFDFHDQRFRRGSRRLSLDVRISRNVGLHC
jgi:hypothetical protein